MKFTKMHGCGNDYVYVNCLEEKINNPNKVAKFISDRHFGIGSDGMICICPSDKADFRMAMYNSDGSEGAMCGNGVRCIAKYVYDYGLTDKTTITIETKGGIKELDLTVEDGKVTWVKVDMEALNKKEQEKLKELERWGYKVNEQQTYFSTHSPLWNYEILETEDNSFIAFADEIMAMYY